MKQIIKIFIFIFAVILSINCSGKKHNLSLLALLQYGNASDFPPVINSFSANPNSGSITLNTTFSWSISDPENSALTCKLDVDNNGIDEYTINNCTSSNTQAHSYTSNGNFTAKLTVIDSKNQAATQSTAITAMAAGDWYQDAYLKASNSDAIDHLGCSVAVSGDTIVVGAYYEESNQTTITNTDGSASADNAFDGFGAAYVFQKDGSGNWRQDAYLKASNSNTGDSFGDNVAISGSTIVVGALWEASNQTTITNIDGSASTDNSKSGSGAVYIFQKDGSGDWRQDAYLKASNSDAGDYFGYSVAVSGTTIVAGAYYESSSQTDITNTDGSASVDNSKSGSGAAYVFELM